MLSISVVRVGVCVMGFFFDIIPQIPNLLVIDHLSRAKLVDSVHFNEWDCRSTVLCDFYVTLIFYSYVSGCCYFHFFQPDLISSFIYISDCGPIGAYYMLLERLIWSTPMRGYYRNY